MSADPALRGAQLAFRNLGMTYPDGTVAVRGISLEIPAGQLCVVLGPSGAGKSTLLRVINGLVTPTAGTASLDGTVIDRRSLPSIRRQVGMIHQSFHLSQRLGVLSNVLSGSLAVVPTWRALLRWFPIHLQRRACHLLSEVGLDERHLYKRACELSGGQQQRVGIARACMLKPRVLLADEPVASLDPATSREILSLLRRACEREGCTVLCSLHQVDLAREFADRIVGVNAGQVVFDGTAAELDDRTVTALYGRDTAMIPKPAPAPAAQVQTWEPERVCT